MSRYQQAPYSDEPGYGNGSGGYGKSYGHNGAGGGGGGGYGGYSGMNPRAAGTREGTESTLQAEQALARAVSGARIATRVA